LMGRLSTRLPNASQTCFIGAISGDSDTVDILCLQKVHWDPCCVWTCVILLEDP
jgi:hypothetical protein